jgi:hypothetical protein
MSKPVQKTPIKASKTSIQRAGGKALGKVVGATIAKGARAINLFAALEAIVGAYGDYKKVAGQETTKRKGIDAWRRVNLERIKTQREILLTYLERTFDERRANFEKYFEVMDSAIEAGQVEVVTKTLDSITQLAKTTPFKDIATVEQVRALLDAPGKDIDL